MDLATILGSAATTAKLVRSRQLSPVEIVEFAIRRIEARNPSLNAFISLSADYALSRASELERRIMSGRPIGAMAGVPTAIKDLFCFYPGWPATFGGISALRERKWEGGKSWFPERVERADAIVLGMTNSPVFGFRGTTDNLLFGPTRNPFDLTRNSGGSSGGSAAAVADGLLAVAHANDGGGSIRIPASWCGVFGFQPSNGRVPLVIRPNAFDTSSPFVFEGPVARTVEDAALVMEQLTAFDPSDPFSRDEPVDWRGALYTPIDGMRIAYTKNFGTFPVTSEVARINEEAVRAFELAGAQVDFLEVKLPYSHEELTAMWCRLVGLRMSSIVDGFKEQQIDLAAEGAGVPDEVFQWIDVARAMSVNDVVRDAKMRTAVFDALNGVYERHDLLVTSTLSCLPVKNGERGATVGPSTVEGEPVDRLIGWCMTYLTNLSGHPAASIPSGMSSGLPVGMQLIGKRGGDFDVMRASASFERIRPWVESYRRCENRTTSGW
jgi:amidase